MAKSTINRLLGLEIVHVLGDEIEAVEIGRVAASSWINIRAQDPFPRPLWCALAGHPTNDTGL